MVQLDGVAQAVHAGAVLVSDPLDLVELVARRGGVDVEVPVDLLDGRVVGDAESACHIDLGLDACAQAS